MKQTNLRKSDIILHTLNPYDPEMQRYLSLSKRIEQLMNNAEDENDPCVPVELMARRTLSEGTEKEQRRS